MTNRYANALARELLEMFFQHKYIPQPIPIEIERNFTSELISELATLLEVELELASPKHPQTIGAAEKSHGPFKRTLKLNTEEQWIDWHK